MPDGATWIASYPKSGNTWLRCLLQAYRDDGALDINSLNITTSDGGMAMVQGVSPIPMEPLGVRGELLIRPAALLNLFCRLPQPLMVKTHFANIQPDGLPPLIPPEFTEKAVYVVRDPRSVILSMSKYYQMTTEKVIEAMSSNDFVVGGNDMFARCMVSSWSNHVASWAGEKNFPVHLVKYEDMLDDPARELTEVLTFLEKDIDEDRIEKAVQATQLSKLRKSERDEGFRENINPDKGQFFSEGGIRWQDELGPKWIHKIEEDHRLVMESMGYLDAPKLQAVK